MNDSVTLKSSIIELPYAVIIFRSEGYLHLHYKNPKPESDEYKTLFDLIQKNMPLKRYPLLVSGQDFSAHRKEARNYNYNTFVVKHCSAIAFVEPNPVRRWAINLYARFFCRTYPTKSFSQFLAAAKWLGYYIPGKRDTFAKPGSE